ncbi:hypothetical protein K488DRAFT_87231 [Vararia minispora EC-137]|uniref:Uncharacterized protein n=1 Tax=Vararia minispora EC-137 TaxID=1314806 RepID=A0ACB8QI89_9AGAM|nr:hypothetical protein K488DRAFT_87231 [Vararia minispora EC-137]
MSSGDDEDYSEKKIKSSSKGDYKIKHALKVPRSTTYTAQSLYDQISEGTIDLSPDYQRDVVWREEKQVNLIDSIFRNFYIPPLIFAVAVSDDGTERRTCIDGKQRLTSIQKFMDGLIYRVSPLYIIPSLNLIAGRAVQTAIREPLASDSPRDKYWYKKRVQGTGYILPVKYQKLFANKQVVCIEYHGLTDDDEREIFRRVQLGMALTNAEKLKAETRNAKSALVQSLTDLYTSRLAALDFETKRDVLYRWMATALFTIRRGIENRSPASFGQVQKWLQDETRDSELSEVWVEGVSESMAKLMEIFERPGTLVVQQGPKTVAPLDFVMSLLLVHTMRHAFSDEDLAIAVKQMRIAARKKVKHVMWNRAAMVPYCDFIQALDQDPDGLKEEGEDMELGEIDDDYGQLSKAMAIKRKATPARESSAPPPAKKNRLAAIQAAKAARSSDR